MTGVKLLCMTVNTPCCDCMRGFLRIPKPAAGGIVDVPSCCPRKDVWTLAGRYVSSPLPGSSNMGISNGSVENRSPLRRVGRRHQTVPSACSSSADCGRFPAAPVNSLTAKYRPTRGLSVQSKRRDARPWCRARKSQAHSDYGSLISTFGASCLKRFNIATSRSISCGSRPIVGTRMWFTLASPRYQTGGTGVCRTSLRERASLLRRTVSSATDSRVRSSKRILTPPALYLCTF